MKKNEEWMRANRRQSLAELCNWYLEIKTKSLIGFEHTFLLLWSKHQLFFLQQTSSCCIFLNIIYSSVVTMCRVDPAYYVFPQLSFLYDDISAIS